MISMFTKMVLGHLIGDFIAQPKWMAVRKSDVGPQGAAICTIHVLIYTLCVAWITGLWSVGFLLAVAVPHWVIDRISWAGIHLKLIGGRTIDTIDANDPWDAPFTAIHYTITDMTAHLMFLYGVLRLMSNGTL